MFAFFMLLQFLHFSNQIVNCWRFLLYTVTEWDCTLCFIPLQNRSETLEQSGQGLFKALLLFWLLF